MAALRFRFAPPTASHGAGGNHALTNRTDHSVGAGQSSFQKNGIGRRLIALAINAATQAGLKEVTLTTFRRLAWNELFYHSCGFETLKAAELTPFLVKVLNREVEAGLSKDMRCAMRRKLNIQSS